jgi:multicomponent Na+:H+ antiporter subunit G
MMDGREIAVVVLLAAAGLVVLLSAVGFLAARDTIARLHFITPVTSVAAPLTGAGYVVQLGPGLASGLAVLLIALLVVSGPALGASIARVRAAQDGLLAEGQEQ